VPCLPARAFGVLHEHGKTEVTAEVDDTNAASTSLLLRLGARQMAARLSSSTISRATQPVWPVVPAGEAHRWAHTIYAG
jgi:hypothetical protein